MEPRDPGCTTERAWTSCLTGWQVGSPSLACPLALHCNLRTLVPQLCRAALAHECEHEYELAGTLEHCNTAWLTLSGPTHWPSPSEATTAMSGLALLGLSVLLGLGAGAPLCLSRQLRMQGDYVLGGLFPLGAAEDTGLGPRTQPNTTLCTRFSSLGLLWALAMKMAVEEINRGSALLPGLRLGHDIFDTCSEPVVAMKPSLVFMAEAGSCDIAAYCDYSRYQPRVLAVVGPDSTELALITGKLFGFFLMPQVSYGASADQLSNRKAFPSFFRTVPSDRVQVTAVVELLHALQWNWVAAVGSDDEYGRQGLSLFSSLANARGICIAHEGLVPAAGAHGLQLGAVQGLLHQVNQSRVQVVVLFSSARAARALFSFSIRFGLAPKVWVASEAWLTSAQVLSLPGLAQVGTVLGFLQRGAPMPDFPSYVQARLALAADPAFCASLDAGQPDLEGHMAGPRCPQCDRILLEDVSAGLLHHRAFAAYAAVYSVAQALHNTLLCDALGCPPRAPVQPWQLLENMYNMSFRVRGLPLRFDANGNVDTGYDLKLWVWRDPEPELRTVGGFDGRLQLQLPQMRWHTPGNVVSARPCPHRTAALEQGLPHGRSRGRGGSSPGSGGAPSPARPESEDPAPEARVPVLEAVPGGPGPPGEGVPLLLLRLHGLQGRQLPAQPRRPLLHPVRPGPVVPRQEPALLPPQAQVPGLGRTDRGAAARAAGPGAGPGAGGPGAFRPAPGQPPGAGLGRAAGLLWPGLPGPGLPQRPPAARLAQSRRLPGPAAAAAPPTHGLPEHPLPAGGRDLCGGGAAAQLGRPAARAPAGAAGLAGGAAGRAGGGGAVHLVPGGLPAGGGDGLAGAAHGGAGTFLVHRQPGRYDGARSLAFAMLAYFITWVSFVPLFTNVHVAYQPAVQMGTSLLCVLGILATFHLPKCYLLLRQPAGNPPEFFLGGGPGSASGLGGSRGGAHDPATSPQCTQT
ncbi:taste receptor type 1 member 3 isoform X2 [Myotis myotis]|uniref:taste receptor type 1 member 3 isoform X2 n=1 Tax=Myotis myotis TaxID=51298 RepID=UPI00174A03A8|nr:taste receptor type 1 member 3 isoform X2 [Myotis myotis]